MSGKVATNLALLVKHAEKASRPASRFPCHVILRLQPQDFGSIHIGLYNIPLRWFCRANPTVECLFACKLAVKWAMSIPK